MITVRMNNKEHERLIYIFQHIFNCNRWQTRVEMDLSDVAGTKRDARRLVSMGGSLKKWKGVVP